MSEFARNAFFGALSLCVIVALWGWGAGQTSSSVLPGPMQVADSLYLGLVEGVLIPHILFTGSAALMGLACGAGLGIGLGALVVAVPLLERFLMPVVVGMQSIPKVAIAPLLVAYLGFGIGSKVFTSALLAFFPIFIACVIGLKAVDREHLRLYRAMDASQLQIIVNLRIPTAISYIFAALRISVVLSLIGCIVSEFVASTRGLGYVIQARSQELDVSMMFAAIICLTALGVTGNLIVRGIERRVVFWKAT